MGSKRIEPRVAGNERARVRPTGWGPNQGGLEGVEQDVVRAGDAEGVALALFGPEDVIVGLVLEPGGPEIGAQLSAKELHAVALVGVAAQTHPD